LDLPFLSELVPLLSPLQAAGAGWLAVAFALGLVHAFDADHVMALSVFATRDRGAFAGARAGLRWSLGHGAVILAAGLVLVAIGRALPAGIAALADRAVGLLMIGLGVFVFVELARRGAHLHFHAHDGLQPHAHWHAHARRAPEQGHHHEHGALLVGALHGLAGSAPILAVLPVAQTSPALAVGYLVLFGLGVATAMVGVSGLLGHVAERLAQRGAGGGWHWLRGAGAAGSVALGAWLAFAG